jgi:hypothetical protein
MDCDYSSPDTCDMAIALAQIDGDQNDDVRTEKGTTSKWFMIYVHEASTKSEQVSYTASLVSPPGVNFDLFVYPGDGNGPKCLSDPLKAMGSPQSVTQTWPDQGGHDDSMWISLEIRYISGSSDTCPPAPWTLKVEGHTKP